MSADRLADELRPETLSEEAFERWLERAGSDPEASRELDFLADLTAAAERGAGRTRRAWRPRRLAILALAAAGLLLAIGLAWWLARPRAVAEPRWAREPAPPYFAVDLRGPDGNVTRVFDEAMASYVRNDWVPAVRALEAWTSQHPEHLPGHFYLAAALEQVGELDRAQAEYARVTSSPGQLGEHALHRLAGLLLSRGDEVAGREALERLRNRGGAFRPNAEALLERLGER